MKTPPRTPKRSRVADALNVAGTVYRTARAVNKLYRAVNSSGGTKTLNKHDDVVEQTEPHQEIKITPTSKSIKTKLKRQNKFKKKIEKALMPDLVFGTWEERCTSADVINVNWGGTVGQTDWQEVASGINGQLMLHHGYGNSTGLSTYPDMVLNLLSSSATDTTTGGLISGTRARRETIKIKTTHAELMMELFCTYSAPLIVDIYTFVAKDDTNLGPYEIWTNKASTGTGGGGQVAFSTTNYTTACDKNLRYQTPLDAPGFGKYWTLQHKDRLEMQANSKLLWRMKGARKPHFNAMTDLTSYMYKGKTQAILVVAFPLADTTIPNGTNILKIHPFKKYHYKRTDELAGNAGLNIAHTTSIRA